MNLSKITILAAAVLALSGCGSQKSIVSQSEKTIKTVEKSSDAKKAQIDFLDKVNDNASFQKNISASITFKVARDNGKEISVPGQLRMRKDQVIRLSLQVPILGTEVGRIEFAKDYVLFVDRMHKEYVKANYNQVGFLRDNGINFYSLQALFWNRLLLPGQASVGYTDLDKFSVNLNGTAQQVPVTLKNGKLTYTWTADRTNGLISKTRVDYASQGHGTSTLTWQYSKFTSLSSKMFPYANQLTIVTPSNGKTRTLNASYEINSISTASDWDAETTLTNKYKQVSVDEILGKLSNM